MAQVNVLELEIQVLLDKDLHTSIVEFQKRVQAQWVEVIMDSLLPEAVRPSKKWEEKSLRELEAQGLIGDEVMT
ncbi:unnamed protein product [Sphagnum troendelagicum]|uniref:Uncharacterized protein n=1 Tax=Sphagnum troendelagicum TaxID=128251 RepID=A0ABP0V227_9BRYO